MLAPYQRKLLVTLNVVALVIHLASAVFGFVLVGQGGYTRTTIVQDSITYYKDKSDAPNWEVDTCNARETDNGGAIIYDTSCLTDGRWDGLLALSIAKLWTSCVHVYFLIEILTKFPATKWWNTQSHFARWVEYSVSATLLTISQTSGIAVSRSIYTLVLIALSFPVVLLTGGASEKLHGMLLRKVFKSSEAEGEAKFMKWVLFACGWLIQGAVFVCIGLAIGASDGSNSEDEQSLWQMVSSVYFIHYFSFPLVFVLWFTGKVFRDFVEVESVYILLSVSSKLALFWAITAGKCTWLTPQQKQNYSRMLLSSVVLHSLLHNSLGSGALHCTDIPLGIDSVWTLCGCLAAAKKHTQSRNVIISQLRAGGVSQKVKTHDHE